jgi:hypothetical protein
MPPEVAQQVIFAITAVGFVVWLCSLSFLLKSAQMLPSGSQNEIDEPTARKWITGCAEVEGIPKALAAKAAAILASGNLGALRIVEKTDDKIVFERLNPGMGKQPPGRWFRRGEIRFTSLGQNRTQVHWTVEPVSGRWLLGVGGIVQGLGLVGLIVGGWAMSTYIAPSPDPAVRWQSLQMLQVVHVLWPPFLFGGLYRRGVRGVKSGFEALANNLPYLET